MPDSTATAYWWAADIPQGAYPVAVANNGGVFMLGSHTQPVMFTIAAVPELSAWVMALVGFAGLAWAAARSQRCSPAPSKAPGGPPAISVTSRRPPGINQYGW